MCGIAASTDSNVSIVKILSYLSHRGQSGCGISILGKKIWQPIKTLGSVATLQSAESLKGRYSVGQTRYPTTGSLSLANLQPIIIGLGNIAFVFNGNVFHYEEEEAWLRAHGYQFKSDGDSERLAASFAYRLHDFLPKSNSYKEAIERTLNHLSHAFDGAYACIASSPDLGMLAFRDPYGIRPLEMFQTQRGVIFASEGVAFQGYEGHQTSVPNHGYVWIDPEDNLCEGWYNLDEELCPRSLCFMELAYLADPKSIIDGLPVARARKYLGLALGAQVLELVRDLSDLTVVPVPKTSLGIAPFVASVLGIPWSDQVIQVVDEHIRTFIQPTPSAREEAVRKKFSFTLPPTRRVLLIDDSICRGTTLKTITRILRDMGVSWVGCASVTPPVQYPAVYGIEMGDVTQLVYAQHDTQDQVMEALGLDALVYLGSQDVWQIVLSVPGSQLAGVSMEYLDNHYLRGRP